MEIKGKKITGTHLLFVAVILIIIVFTKPLIGGDGFGYYAITRGLVEDGSLELSNQKYLAELSGTPTVYYNEATGRWVSFFAIGKPLMDVPMYVLGREVSKHVHIADEFFIRKTGDTLFPQIAVNITTLLFIFLALFLSIKLLEYFKEKKASLIVFLAFIGTPIIFYTTHESIMTAGVEAGLLALIIWLFLKKDNKPLLLGLALGISFIVKYTTGAFLIPVLLWYAYKRNFKALIKIVLGFIPFVALFLYYNFTQFGKLVGGYPSFFESVIPIHLLEIFFDAQRGLLWWSPLLVLGLIGLFYLKHEKKWFLILFPITQFIIFGCWKYWHAAWSFSNRFFVVLFPLVCIGIYALIKKYPRTKYLVIVSALWGFLLFLLFMAEIEHVSTPTNLLDTLHYWFVEGNIISLPEFLFEKVSVVRFLTESGGI